jgi:cyclic pyranopterin phosphate synthase
MDRMKKGKESEIRIEEGKGKKKSGSAKVISKKDKTEKLLRIVRSGKVRMVDVAEKPETLRTAEARGEVRVSAVVLKMILENRLPKGDVLGAARLAGIQAAKKTSELIPLCHPLRITSVEVEIRPDEGENLVKVRSRVRAVDRTGVEMEALMAVAVACLTVYDMGKAFDKRMVIGDIHLVSKSGGKSGDFRW